MDDTAHAATTTSKLADGPLADIGDCVFEAVASTDIPETFTVNKISKGEKEWKYVLYVPPSYDPDTAWPTIVFLGGYGQCGTDGRSVLSSGLGPAVVSSPEKWPFIIVFPQKPKPEPPMGWIESDDLVMSILEHARRTMNVDRSRIYLTGLSEGGRGAIAIAARHPDSFAAIVPIAVYIGEGQQREYAERIRNVPIWMHHSKHDEILGTLNVYRLESLLHRSGAQYRLTLYDRDDTRHDCWSEAYGRSDLPAWLLSHTNQCTDRAERGGWTGSEVIPAEARPDSATTWSKVIDLLQRSEQPLRTVAAIASDAGLAPQDVRDAMADHHGEIVERRRSSDGMGLYGARSRLDR